MGLWHMWRGAGMAPGPLPEAGGSGDQAAIMMDAFNALSAAWNELHPRERE